MALKNPTKSLHDQKGVYTLKADGCKSKIFPIEEKEEEVEEIIEEDIAEPEEPDDTSR